MSPDSVAVQNFVFRYCGYENAEKFSEAHMSSIENISPNLPQFRSGIDQTWSGRFIFAARS